MLRQFDPYHPFWWTTSGERYYAWAGSSGSPELQSLPFDSTSAPQAIYTTPRSTVDVRGSSSR